MVETGWKGVNDVNNAIANLQFFFSFHFPNLSIPLSENLAKGAECDYTASIYFDDK